MRTIKTISPTSISTWQNDKEEFYVRYLSDDRPPRPPQTQPMAIGSAFDAYIKNYLSNTILDRNDPAYTFEALFEAQVETHNRDWAKARGEYVFNCYKQSGVCADLARHISSSDMCEFEFTVHGAVESAGQKVEREIGHVKFLGKPDARFTIEGQSIIHDWKVNGFCAKTGPSPKKGYVRIRDGWPSTRAKTSRSHGSSYRGLIPSYVGMVPVNTLDCFGNYDKSWAAQTAIYSWLCGEPVGGDFIISIDQLVCKPDEVDRPLIRVAEHRCKISPEFQQKVYDEAQEMWDIIHSDWIFRDLTKEQSQERCVLLDQKHKLYKSDDPKDKWLANVLRGAN